MPGNSFHQEIPAKPTRLPSTLMAANHWSGGRPASFLQQGLHCELQWLTTFFMSPVVLVKTPSPPSCRGILPRRPGNQPVNLPRREKNMQPLLCHLRFYHLSVQQCFKYSVCFNIIDLCSCKVACLPLSFNSLSIGKINGQSKKQMYNNIKLYLSNCK